MLDDLSPILTGNVFALIDRSAKSSYEIKIYLPIENRDEGENSSYKGILFFFLQLISEEKLSSVTEQRDKKKKDKEPRFVFN